MDYLPGNEAFQAPGPQFVPMISTVSSGLDDDGHEIAYIDRRLKVRALVQVEQSHLKTTKEPHGPAHDFLASMTNILELAVDVLCVK
jgi:hypothetical protein